MDKQKRMQLKELLHSALKAEGAEMGIIRNYESADDELVVISHFGLPKEYLSHFYSVKPFDTTSCGRAFGISSTILINDIEQDLAFKKHLKTIRALNAEFRAVKSVPILTSRGRKLGVFTSHFYEPKWDWHFNHNDKILTEMADLLY